MTKKDILYLVMFYILKHRDSKSSDLYDLYDLVVQVTDDFVLNYCYQDVISVLRKRCLSMRCARIVLDFCKFAEKFAKICKGFDM